MRRTSSPESAVSLFPFLAVLVCTMGALVLLLLALTQQVRQQAQDAARRSQEPRAPAALARAAEDLAEPEPPHKLDLHRPAPEMRPIEAEATAEPAEPATPPPSADEALATRIAELRGATQRQLEEQARRAATLAEANQRRQVLEERLAQLEARRQRVAQESRAQQARQASLLKRENELEGQLALTQRKIDLAQKRQAAAPSEFALVPYEGQSGTQRRPIYIECTDHGYRFLPEDEFIGPRELDGCDATCNPLVTGARALLDYWQALHAQHPEEHPRPYVLLLVRPGGISAYEMARHLLAPLRIDFGYELIEESFPLAKLPADEGARAALRDAIALTLALRDQILARRANRAAPGNAERREPTTSPPQARPATLSGRPETANPTQGAATAPADWPPLLPGANDADQPQPQTAPRSVRRQAPADLVAGDARAAQGGPPPQPDSDLIPGDLPARQPTAPVGEQVPDPVAPLAAPRDEAAVSEEGPRMARKERPSRRNLIGLERAVQIRVEADCYLVGEEAPLVVLPQPREKPEQLAERLAGLIEREVESWGNPPARFYWIPRVRFVVAPAGNALYERIRRPLARLGIASAVEFSEPGDLSPTPRHAP